MGVLRRFAVAAVIAALAAVVSLPAGAYANHLTPSIQVKLEIVRKARECGRNTVGQNAACGWRGGYVARLSWSASCGPEPGASAEIALNTSVVKRNGKLGIGYTTSNPDALSGEERVDIRPGLKLRPAADVTCVATTSDGNSETTHSARAQAVGADVFVRPFLDGYAIRRGTICGVRVPSRKIGTTFQARQSATVTWGLRFTGTSLLRPGNLGAQLRQISLRASGAARLRGSPVRHLLRENDYAQFVRPRRGGRVKLWAVIGGVATNTVTARALPRRGC